MRLLVSLFLLSSAAPAALGPFFHVISRDPGAWPQVLESIGLQPGPLDSGRILVTREGSPVSADLTARVNGGAILVLEGQSPLAESFGFKPGKETEAVASIRDIHMPDLPIVWERPLLAPRTSLPAGAIVFSREKWKGFAVSAGVRRGAGAIFWVAAPLGERGYERFPYILQALCDLGLKPPLRSDRLWAFFDSSYRLRVDVDYFAARWRKAGISGLQVAGWHFYESDPEGDAYLKRLIAACHREGILVYAWLELPHVSERFWTAHPEWREKTAALQDAQLDWRKLMNLQNPDCFRAVSTGVRDLIGRFDWDGVNLAELYFESLEGMNNPARFTPMNDDVRRRFRKERGFDPIELFRERRDAPSQRLFLDFRRDLARVMQSAWLNELEGVRESRPELDLVLTHVDDRFDTGMRDAIGADASEVLPMLDQHRFTFLIEDPATVWNLGPQRYGMIADKYRALTPRSDRLAIDLNIVDRYQDVYPTKQQTGTELFQLMHDASSCFERVALYFENSLLPPDLMLLPFAAGRGQIRWDRSELMISSTHGIGVPWKGGVAVDSRPWPVSDGETAWLPAGDHRVGVSENSIPVRLLRFTGDLRSASVFGGGIKFAYVSSARALAILDRPPKSIIIDGAAAELKLQGTLTLLLPPGEHSVTISVE